MPGRLPAGLGQAWPQRLVEAAAAAEAPHALRMGPPPPHGHPPATPSIASLLLAKPARVASHFSCIVPTNLVDDKEDRSATAEQVSPLAAAHA
ncbi:hypothetical protein AB1Y20_015723 [Prymnesium parvum]|uniref:Uncharacterized protein n=1 Tax=Prymnesium parvum TaxID=97485 RepID=A0AB34K1T8_PRYPA